MRALLELIIILVAIILPSRISTGGVSAVSISPRAANSETPEPENSETPPDLPTDDEIASASSVDDVETGSETTDEKGFTVEDSALLQKLAAKAASSVAPGATDAPVEDVTDTPVEDVTDTPVDDASDEPVDDASETPVEDTSETPVEDTSDTPGEEGIEGSPQIDQLLPEEGDKVSKTPEAEGTVESGKYTIHYKCSNDKNGFICEVKGLKTSAPWKDDSSTETTGEDNSLTVIPEAGEVSGDNSELNSEGTPEGSEAPEGGEDKEAPEGGEDKEAPEGGEDKEAPKGGEDKETPEGGEDKETPEGGEDKEEPEEGGDPKY